MDFPRFVFTSPGPQQCQGGTYGQELVQDQVEYDAAIKAGFCATLPEALESKMDKKSPQAAEAKAPSDPVRATRAPRAKKNAPSAADTPQAAAPSPEA